MNHSHDNCSISVRWMLLHSTRSMITKVATEVLLLVVASGPSCYSMQRAGFLTLIRCVDGWYYVRVLNFYIVYLWGWFIIVWQILHSGEGPVHAVRWRGSLIAWANDTGVKIYDCNTNEKLTWIDRPRGSPAPEKYRCSLCWARCVFNFSGRRYGIIDSCWLLNQFKY